MLPPSVGSPGGECQEVAPRVTAARRLTREQYAATVRDLLGDVGAAADKLPADDGGDGLFVSPATLIVSPSWAENALGGGRGHRPGGGHPAGHAGPVPRRRR